MPNFTETKTDTFKKNPNTQVKKPRTTSTTSAERDIEPPTKQGNNTICSPPKKPEHSNRSRLKAKSLAFQLRKRQRSSTIQTRRHSQTDNLQTKDRPPSRKRRTDERNHFFAVKPPPISKNQRKLVLYQGDIIANSSIESYNLIPYWAQQLNVSSIASEGDMDGEIVIDIMEDIKKRGEIRFGSRVILPDCRYGTSGKMEYACDEAMLRFEPGSQRKATAFGNQPTCVYVR